MWAKIKKIAGFISFFWCCGGGFLAALLGFIWTWKLALAIFCAWGSSCIVAVMIIIRIAVNNNNNKTKEG